VPPRDGRAGRLALLWAAAGLWVVAALAAPVIRQPAGYHDFADQRSAWGVPRAADVLSNAAIGIGALAGLLGLARRAAFPGRLAYAIFFACMLATTAGSSWYHLAPDDARLIWDRLPIALGSVALPVALLAERVAPVAQRRLLLPALLLAPAAVWLWWDSHLAGAGDLRAYLAVTAFPLVLVPAVLWLFPCRAVGTEPAAAPAYCVSAATWWTVLALYAAARLAEVGDAALFTATGERLSGHTVKHLAAGAAVAVLAAGLAAAGRRQSRNCASASSR